MISAGLGEKFKLDVQQTQILAHSQFWHFITMISHTFPWSIFGVRFINCNVVKIDNYENVTVIAAPTCIISL